MITYIDVCILMYDVEECVMKFCEQPIALALLMLAKLYSYSLNLDRLLSSDVCQIILGTQYRSHSYLLEAVWQFHKIILNAFRLLNLGLTKLHV